MLDNPHMSQTAAASGRKRQGIDARGFTPTKKPAGKTRTGLAVLSGARAGGVDPNHNRRALRLPSGLTARQALDRLLRAVADPVRRAVRQ